MVCGGSIDWLEVILEDVCSKITVGHVSRMADQYLDDGIPFLRSQNIKPFGLDLSDVKFISASFHHKLRKSVIHPGDVVIVRTGYPGTAAVVPPELPVANCADLVIVRPGPALHPWFLAALLNSVYGKGFVSGVLVGAAQQHFNVGAARRLKFRLPPADVQDRIASILSAYDDLIENNTRRIAILEEMARALYQEWFVHFRFPGHEHVPLVDSPLGPIPEGWELKATSELLEVDPKIRSDKDAVKPFVPMSGLSEHSMLISDVHTKETNSGARFQNGDTLLARITPCLENGKTGYVDFLPSDSDVAHGSTEFIVLRGGSVCSEFVYLLARSHVFRDHAIKSMSGATGRQRVRNECFNTFYLAEPDQAAMARFKTIVEPMFQTVLLVAKKNDNLRITRDLLLPKLISGEIDVSALHAEPIAEAAD
jgi:type I restriction enzyme, S subunit